MGKILADFSGNIWDFGRPYHGIWYDPALHIVDPTLKSSDENVTLLPEAVAFWRCLGIERARKTASPEFDVISKLFQQRFVSDVPPDALVKR